MLTLPLTIFFPRLLCGCFTLELSDHSSPRTPSSPVLSFPFLSYRYNSGQSPVLPTVRQEMVGTGPALLTAVCWCH